MKVLIVGGGIGGPALATFLSRKGIEVVLIDHASKWKNIGFGLTLWGVGRKIVSVLGIEKELLAGAYEVPSIQAFSSNGTETWKSLLFRQFARYGGSVIIVPRSCLHELIIQSMRSVTVRLGISVKKLVQMNNKVDVTFTDDTKETFDVVVGADGVHSRIREIIFKNEQAVGYGWRFWVFWTPKGAPIRDHAFSVTVPQKAMGFWPLGTHHGFIGIGDYSQNTVHADPQTLLASFKPFLIKEGWNKKHFAEVLKNAPQDFFDEVYKVPMGRWYSGRVVLLGDARHAFAPIIGFGASLALEDAYVLAQELSKCGDSSIDRALAEYAKRRDGRVRRIRRFSSFIESWADVHHPILLWLRDVVGPLLPSWLLSFPIKMILREKV